MYTEVKKCIEWICSKVGRATSEEEVERLCLRYLLRSGLKLSCDESFVECVKNALFQEPITLVYYPEKLETSDGTIYHLHVELSGEEIKRAREEMLKSRRLIDSSCIVDRILRNFFGEKSEKEKSEKGEKREKSKVESKMCEKGGESCKSVESVSDKFPFRVYRRRGGKDYLVYFSLIEDVFEDAEFHLDIAEELSEYIYVIVVLTEKTPLPFIKFFRNYSEIFRRFGILVWVADVEREFLNPFIGYPPEEELISRFKNPEVATKVESLWRCKVSDVDGG